MREKCSPSQPRLQGVQKYFKAYYYTLGFCTTMRGFRKFPPAKDHCWHKSFKSENRVCSPFLQSLNTTAFLCFQMLHRVKIAKLWIVLFLAVNS